MLLFVSVRLTFAVAAMKRHVHIDSCCSVSCCCSVFPSGPPGPVDLDQLLQAETAAGDSSAGGGDAAVAPQAFKVMCCARRFLQSLRRVSR